MIAALTTLLLAAGFALAGIIVTPGNFEVDGDLRAGIDEGGNIPEHAENGVDWAAGPGGTPALICDPAPAPGNFCTPASVGDNPAEPGTATFFQDGLKGSDDTTFTEGDKENDCVKPSPSDPCTVFLVDGTQTSKTPWHIVTGNIPPNKDDLSNIYQYVNVVGGQATVVLGVERTNNLGTSHLDYELNRLGWEACVEDATKLCPRRSEGDLLVAYEISNGGAVTSVKLYLWELDGGIDVSGESDADCSGELTGPNPTKSCPWEEVTFPATDVISFVNQDEILGGAGPWGFRNADGTITDDVPEFGFFETFIDFDALGFGPGCPGFAQASVKTRSSDSLDAALQDLGGPFPLNLSTCGSITVTKVTNPASDPQDFGYTAVGQAPVGGTFSLDTDADATLSNTKSFLNVVKPGAYTITEDALPSGWAITGLSCSTSGAGTSAVTNLALRQVSITMAANGSVSCTYTNTKTGTIIVEKQTNPAGDAQLFTFTGDAAGSIADNGQITVSNLVPGTYTSTETVPAGWDLTGLSCDDGASTTPSTTSLATATATFKLDPGETVKCTFTNTERGKVTVIKTVSGQVPPAGMTFDFEIRTGASATELGTTVASGTTDATGNLVFNNLVPGTYQFCEVNMMPGWHSSLSDIIGSFVPDSDDPNHDNSVVCVQFVLDPGENQVFNVDNTPPPGGDARTIGFWKNWTSCDGSGNQDDVLDQTLAEFPIAVGQVTHGVYVGDLYVDTCEEAVSILSKESLDGKKRASDAAYALAAQLLAAMLNVQADAGTCQAALDAIEDGQALLANNPVNFLASGSYLDSKVKGALKAIRTDAVEIAGDLDDYNNNTLCP